MMKKKFIYHQTSIVLAALFLWENVTQGNIVVNGNIQSNEITANVVCITDTIQVTNIEPKAPDTEIVLGGNVTITGNLNVLGDIANILSTIPDPLILNEICLLGQVQANLITTKNGEDLIIDKVFKNIRHLKINDLLSLINYYFKDSRYLTTAIFPIFLAISKALSFKA